MKIKQFKVVVAALSCVGMLVSPGMVAASQVTAIAVAPAPQDVKLHEGGVLTGQVLNAQGAAVANSPVSVRSAGKEVVRVQTDQAGKFSIAGLQGGVHEVVTVESQGVYRLWAPHTAPPAAQQGLLLVSNGDLVRGQSCGSGVGCGSGCGTGCGGGSGIGAWVANHPIITAGAIAAAIAIPLALDDDDAPATP